MPTPPATSTTVTPRPVRDLTRAREARRAALQARRDELARSVVDRESHGLAVPDDLRDELGVVEQALLNHAPHRSGALIAAWAQVDARRAHTPDQPAPGCPICALAGSTSRGAPPPAAA